ncbi:hypothetical protein LIER_28145 [Lithospermum erythrorhizon]|uniref:TF-B3 domain-containing protein n=1 Tax=Lithospermum erythrorhizon TaxID=34254 RepID=A0AAV3RHK0_LITER
MALSSSTKGSHHSSSKVKQRRVSELKNKYLCKKTTTKPFQEEENAREFVECSKQIVESSRFISHNSLALGRAHDVLSNLDQNFPAFVKLMLRSHVTGGFWLGLPRSFCVNNLPNHDETVVLIAQNDEEYKTKYLVAKNGLSGGWRAFSIAHNLLEGDVLVFQLIGIWKLKVFIVRANDLTEVDGAISLLNLHTEVKPTGEAIPEALMHESVEPPGSCIDQVCSQGNDATMLVTDAVLPSDQFGNQSFGSDVSGEIRFLESVVDFKDVKSFNGFTILVDGLSVDSEVNEHVRKKYYELCCSQMCYLHEHLLAGLNFKLVAGIISETVNIADAIRASKFVTPVDYLETFDKTLKSFEDLGMTVGFLRERLKKLGHISHELKKKFETMTLERTELEEEIRSLKLKLVDADRAMRSLDDEMKALKVEGKKFELSFKETASAPW